MQSLILLMILAGGCFGEEIVQATTCELANHPERYQHKLVEVSSGISREFEDFTLDEPPCKYSVWLEFGGKKSSRTIYCCPGSGEVRKRPKPLMIDGVETKLVDDKILKKFDKESKKHVRARLVGRFFAKSDRGGFGHFGCCSLFVIERVLDVQLLKSEITP